jgi:hypothetical protein
MVARQKSMWFGCVLAASLFVLVLAGCGDASESGSSQMAQPSDLFNSAQELGGL